MPPSVIVLKRAHFFSIDNDIIDVHAKNIGAIGLAIYAVLARYANRRTGECWPAIARMQRMLNLGRSTVKRYLHRLEAAGLISVGERWSDDGDRTSNRYTLLNPAPEAIADRQHITPTEESDMFDASEGGGSTQTRPPIHPEQEGGVTADPHEPNLLNIKKETTVVTGDAEKTPRQSACPHPPQEQSRIGDLTLCYHCWSILENADNVSGEGQHDPHSDMPVTTSARAA